MGETVPESSGQKHEKKEIFTPKFILIIMTSESDEVMSEELSWKLFSRYDGEQACRIKKEPASLCRIYVAVM